MSRLLAALVLLATPFAASAATYEIDPGHTYAGFSIAHMMVSEVRGSFSDVTGTIHIDPAKLADTKVDVTIAVASIDTRLAKRDEHLKSPEFFDAAKFPTMAFKSKSVRDVKGASFKLVGDLTLHGVTKEVVLDVKGPTAEAKDPWGNMKVGFSGTTKLNRKDFGLVYNTALETGGVMIGDEVEIELEVEAKRL